MNKFKSEKIISPGRALYIRLVNKLQSVISVKSSHIKKKILTTFAWKQKLPQGFQNCFLTFGEGAVQRSQVLVVGK